MKITIKISLIAFLLSLVTAEAQSQETEFNRFEIQQWQSIGFTRFSNEFFGLLVGDSAIEVCHQMTSQVIASYPDLEDQLGGHELVEYEVADPFVREGTSLFSPRTRFACIWPITRTHTDLDGIFPPRVFDQEEAAHVNRACQKDDHAEIPSAQAFHYRSPNHFLDESPGDCACIEPFVFNQGIQWCQRPHVEENEDICNGSNENSVGNPCNVATGNKRAIEQDITSGTLTFGRSYNSQALNNVGLGIGWRGSHDKLLSFGNNEITVSTSGGKAESWRSVDGQWQSDADTDISVTESVDGRHSIFDRVYDVTHNDGAVDRYNYLGLLETETDANGNVTTYNHTSGTFGARISRINNEYGHVLGFDYNDNLLVEVRDHLGVSYHYEYDDNTNLVAVIYPDLTEDNESDNPRKIYHYENEDFPNHLTGITDENGDRYATYAYDEQGKAISTEHAQTTNNIGQERFDIDYQGAQ